eukprot:350943-Chlamydomonas_euryale.AAC.3
MPHADAASVERRSLSRRASAGAGATAAVAGARPRQRSLVAAGAAFSRSYLLSAGGRGVLKVSLQPPLDGHLQVWGVVCVVFLWHAGSAAAAAA